MSTEIKQLILKHTGGTGHLEMLRGPLAKDARREILETLLGTTVPFSAAGINRLFTELEALARIGPGRTTAQRRKILFNWILEKNNGD